MIVIEREELLTDLVFRRIFHSIQKNHKIPEYTFKILQENKDVSGFCEQSRFFAILKDVSPIYISYECSTRIDDQSIIATIDRINFYEDHLEYEVDRMKGMHSTDHNNFAERN